LFERRAFDLSRPRALRAPGSEYEFLRQSRASTASFSKQWKISFWSSSPERTRERGRREEIKKNNERKTSLSRERAFLKNTNTIYDIKYAAIFHVQNDVRVPRRHFSFHRHLTHVLRRPGRRREHFTFHFFSFNVYLCLLIMCFLLVVCSSFLFFRVFFTRTRTKNQIKRYLETSARANQKAHEGGLFPLDGLKKNASYKHTAFDVNLDRKQQTKNSSARERERGFEGEDDALG